MKQISQKQGFTLVECMVMMMILMITLGGTLGFRYFSVLSAERAEDRLLAAHAAQVLSDAWRGEKGALDFDPTQQGFDSDFLVQTPTAFTVQGGAMFGSVTSLGTYQIDIEGRMFQAFLTYQDDMTVPNARLLYVTLTWQDRNQVQQVFKLTTLTRTNV